MTGLLLIYLIGVGAFLVMACCRYQMIVSALEKAGHKTNPMFACVVVALTWPVYVLLSVLGALPNVRR